MTRKITMIPIEHKVLAVVDNFQCDLPQIELSKNLSIRRIDTLSSEEQAVFAGEEFEQRFHGHNYIKNESRTQVFTFVTYRSSAGEQLQRTKERGNYVVYWSFKERVQEPIKEHYDFFLKPDSEFGSVMSALRVLKDAMIGLYPHEHFLIQLPLPKEFPRMTYRALDGYQVSNPTEVEPYILCEQDVDTLKQLYAAVRSIKQQGVLTALSRLDRQYSRAYIADRLIDAVVALEALYAGDNTAEIALRAGLRMSAHLGGKDPDRREHYFNLFNLAYNLRSRLVHGGIHTTADIDKLVKKNGWQDSEAFMVELDNALRQSLRYILLHANNRKLKEFLHEPLDQCIRRGEPFDIDSPQ